MSNNAFFKPFILGFAVFIISCGKSAAPPGPADAVLATYNALEAQDTTAFLASLSQDKVDAYTMYPDRIDTIMKNWKGEHAEVKVLSVKQNDSTTATVLYNLTVTGPRPHSHDSIHASLVMEGGEWKHGY
ncbi:MAG TPA: hypothetical protein VFH95_01700 [Candidatus Kapabacteria bacterium]|nr:hypothetical protein [Candidatus Kapabacteria bacterium]